MSAANLRLEVRSRECDRENTHFGMVLVVVHREEQIYEYYRVRAAPSASGDDDDAFWSIK
jgi:hypothetical protein